MLLVDLVLSVQNQNIQKHVCLRYQHLFQSKLSVVYQDLIALVQTVFHCVSKAYRPLFFGLKGMLCTEYISPLSKRKSNFS